ncbi:hemolin-like [Vanessa cardui]|uniref:hemolin-like n=1 Tax=Vanessa cardui TaxID=171605 RepID=UPI001F13F663|nr:hemolin-like [Vanessa cardui]
MFRITNIVTLAVCAVICASQPVEKLPVLKSVPNSEVHIHTPKTEIVLECVTTEQGSDVKYTWLKDGKPFTPTGDVIQRENEGTLVFKHPDQSNEGQYQCLAQSQYGVARTRPVTLKKSFMEKPEFTLKKHKPVEGDPFKLDCVIPKAYPKPSISWLRKSLTDDSDVKMVQDQRYTISPEGVLYFSNVTKDDTSSDYKYVCVAKSPESGDMVTLAEHILEEVEPNKGPVNNDVVEQYVSQDMTVKAGDFVYLYCIYGGNPLAHPDWFKDGQDVNNGVKDRVTRHNRSVGKRLVIKEAWVSDQGEYTCVVDNEVGKPQRHSMYLTVVSAPQFLRDDIPKMIVKPGEDITIPCIAAGIPAPELSWSYNADELPKNDRIALSRSSQGNTTVSDLTIKGVQKEDMGYYGCKGLNENGDIYKETLLYVQ